MIQNLLSNSIKYNKPFGKIYGSTVEHPIDDTHSMFVITVEDTGIGMSEEYLQNVFDPFSRDVIYEQRVQGTGLGMAIVREIMDALQGEIFITSELDKGTKVELHIPMELDFSQQNQKINSPKPFSLEGKRILLAEDNELNAEIATYMLAQKGATVTLAGNGHMAVELLEQSEPGFFHVVLMDIRMPKMDGIEATRCIRNLDRKDLRTIPIVALTANAFEEDMRVCTEAGMNDHIAKPIDVDRLNKILSKYLE